MKEQEFNITAKTFSGLEEILAKEIAKIGGNNIDIRKRSVYYNGTKEVLYKSNLYLRTALRILKPISRFRVHNEKSLYNSVKKIEWEKYLDINSTFAIDAVTNSKYFKHSKYSSLKTKDAIADYFREKYNQRPSVNIDNPSLRIHLHIDESFCTLSLDSSGSSLHKRGYRTEKNDAPLNEVLAAGIILLSGWQCDCNFLDPMCGSGTLPIEAAMIAYNIAPGKMRKVFGFMNWRDFDIELWNKLLKEAENLERDFCFNILGSDINPMNIEISERNIARAFLANKIKLETASFFSLKNYFENGIIITNPPYGVRLEKENILKLYEKIGDKFKSDFTGFTAWILSSNKEALKKIGLRTSKRVTLFNGSLECKYYNYQLYSGSKKRKYQN